MNYRHIYHAGSFTDVVKHVILTALVDCLTKKDKPFCYLDTHAGTGYYDLFSERAKKTHEFESGIVSVMKAANPPLLVKQYLYSVHKLNNILSQARFASLRYYPGSPQFVRYLLRPKDRMVLCELHPQEYQSLQQHFAGDRQVAVHHADGYTGLKAFLPPRERRGLILIDPPFENPEEFDRITKALPQALERFATGVFTLWYPIKEQSATDRFLRKLKSAVQQPVQLIEFTIYPESAQLLRGCGVLVVNPPWKFDQMMHKTLPWLWKALSINQQGAYSLTRS